MSNIPVVALVGRPNVGKSTLFNFLTRTRDALVADVPGLTRDRQYGDAEWFGRVYTVIDTGGFVPETDEPILVQMRNQAQLAMDEADAIIFMMDGRAGLVASDSEIVEMLRLTEKPVFHVINKVDAWMKREEFLHEFYELGAELYPISAEHGHGLDAMMDDVTGALPVIPFDDRQAEDDPRIKVAVVGKPNAGKSSMVNALLGEERRFDSYLVPTEVVGGWHIGTGDWGEGIFMRYRVVRCSFH